MKITVRSILLWSVFLPGCMTIATQCDNKPEFTVVNKSSHTVALCQWHAMDEDYTGWHIQNLDNLKPGKSIKFAANITKYNSTKSSGYQDQYMICIDTKRQIMRQDGIEVLRKTRIEITNKPTQGWVQMPNAKKEGDQCSETWECGLSGKMVCRTPPGNQSTKYCMPSK